MTELCIALAAHILNLAEKGSYEECEELAKDAIANGTALKTFADMVEAQGGEKDWIYNPEKFPKAKAQFLTEIGMDEEIERMIAHKIDADFWSECVTKEKVDRLHKEGRIVNCWTVDDVKTAEKMKSFGVDMITTDILE